MTQIEKLYEDEYILVLNKPVGLVVNRSNTAKENTLQDWLEENYSESFISADKNSEFFSRKGIVHRLDKDTSGVIVIAKDENSFLDIQSQFKERTVKKEYLALVFGEIKENFIEINAPIARNPKIRTKMAVVEGGRPSVTRVEKIRILNMGDQPVTLVRVFPRTGRTHQIRVHLGALGHPVLGDYLYAGRRRSTTSREQYGRLMLHAYRLTFNHPNGDTLTVEATPPDELKI